MSMPVPQEWWRHESFEWPRQALQDLLAAVGGLADASVSTIDPGQARHVVANAIGVVQVA